MNGWQRLHDALAGARRRFEHEAAEAGAVQRAQLAAILAANRDCAFGRDHGFAAITSYEQFRERVPVRRYEEFAPLIGRMAAGEPRVLCAEPVLAFERTGGSTGGAKLIPCTAAGLAGFARALHPWLDDLLAQRPGIATGRAYWSISPAGRGPAHTPGGAPIGLPDAAYFGAGLATDLAAQLAVPPAVGAIADLEAWRARTLDALVAARDLTFISVWSPTFLLELLRPLGDVDTRALWPALDTLSCWTDAGARRFLPALRAAFPHARIQGKGLLATEAAVTIPLAGLAAPVLALGSAFFEFVDGHGVPRLGDALVEGEVYGVVVTTASGLYRYDLGDLVRVRGRLGAAPLLEFVGRAGVVSDLCGEKLTEAFVLACLAPAQGFAMLAPSLDGHPHYALFVDADAHDAAAAGALRGEVERALDANPQYAYARGLNQLAALAVHRVRAPAATVAALGLARGQRLGDVKPPALSADPGWERRFAPA